METTTQTNTTANETTQTAKTKAPSSTYYTAVVFREEGPAKVLDFIEAKTKLELTKTLADPTITVIHAIFKGKKINFAMQSKLVF